MYNFYPTGKCKLHIHPKKKCKLHGQQIVTTSKLNVNEFSF